MCWPHAGDTLATVHAVHVHAVRMCALWRRGAQGAAGLALHARNDVCCAQLCQLSAKATSQEGHQRPSMAKVELLCFQRQWPGHGVIGATHYTSSLKILQYFET